MSISYCPNEKPTSIVETIFCTDPNCEHIHWGDYGTDKYKEFIQSQIVQIIDKKKYWLLTFTKSPDSKPLDWFDSVISSLHSKQIDVLYLSMEHLDTNVHVHAFVSSLNNLSRDKFKSFTKQHILDIKKVKKDNGINKYLEKENKAFNNIDDFEIFYRNLILEKNI